MIPLAEALAWLEHRTARLNPETVALAASAGRVLAEDVEGPSAPDPIAAIDGLAVAAAATEGASDYMALPLAGVPIVAGMALPPGTDAVLPIHLFDAGPVALGPVPPGHGVAPREAAGLRGGTLLRPIHLALLASLGRDAVVAVRRPAVALRVAGPKRGPDALTPMLAALLAAEGAVAGGDAPDLVIHAGRSGPGSDDHGIIAFDEVFAHGIAIAPGETAALGAVGGTTAILLPGDPLACAAAFAVLAAPALRRLGGREEPRPVPAILTRKIVSTLGVQDVVRVRLAEGQATPLPPLLSSAAEADGFVLAPAGSEGYGAGATVSVHKLP